MWKKSPGPDKIGGHLLKVCAEQLAPVFCNIFQRSIALQRFPKLWKEATAVPVPTTTRAVTLNDLRPIALTSLIMKCSEKLVKDELLSKTKDLLDPLQFAYRTKRGVEDATATLLNMVLQHLEGSKTHAKLLFIDFSSAF